MKRLRVFGFLVLALALSVAPLMAQHGPPAAITVDYPSDGSIFPPDMVAPTFLWRDPENSARTWRIDVKSADGSAVVQVRSPGGRPEIGEIDERAISETNKLPELTPQQVEAHTWK